MNILQINSIDSRGGAAKVSSRLGKQLVKSGNTVNTLVGHKTGDAASTQEIKYSEHDAAKNRRFKLHGALLPTATSVGQHQYFESADVVHMHNLHLEPNGYFNIRHLKTLATDKPTVWTLHDPWLIYEHGQIPQYDYFFSDIPFWYNYLKRRSARSANLIIVSPSKWLANLTAKYFPEKRIEVIPNGVDTRIFKPTEQAEARKKLGLNHDQKIVLFVANEGQDNGPKGANFLKEARAGLSGDINFISLGSSKHDTYVNDESQMALYYSAANVFVLPSLAENLPLTIIEAMACGTPAVAFGTGGVDEVIRHLDNGYIAKYKDSNDLAKGIKLMLEVKDNIGQKATKSVSDNFSLKKMSDSYLALYSSII